MLLPQSLAQHADEYTSHWWSSCPLIPISFLLAYWGFHQLYIPDQGQPLTYRQYWTPIKNILIVVVNFWLAVAIWNNAQALNYNFLCEPVGNPASSSWIWDDKSGRNALIHAMKDKSFYFLLVKIVECLDTIVMSMRGGLYYTWVFLASFFHDYFWMGCNRLCSSRDDIHNTFGELRRTRTGLRFHYSSTTSGSA